jgi:uncharacterized membrane protein YphA (DoxX/SURF4 family)
MRNVLARHSGRVNRLRSLVTRRFLDHPSWVILIEMFIGLGWLRAATEKVISSAWWNGDEIRALAEEHEQLTMPWFRPVLTALLDMTPVVTVVVLVGQLLAGIALVSGIRVRTGLFIGMTMNLVFIMIGAVDPSIFYLMLQAVLWLWLFEHHVPRNTSLYSLNILIGAAAVLALASVPFVSSLDPGNVVEDPAIILVTYGLSVGLSCWVAKRRVIEQPDRFVELF